MNCALRARSPIQLGYRAAALRRLFAIVIGILGILGALTETARAEPAIYRIAPTAPWALEDAALPPTVDESSEATHGIRTLLFDRRIRFGKERDEVYTRVVQRIESATGLEAASRVEVDVDPASYALTLNAVTVSRAGVTTNRLVPSEIKVIQREPNLDRQVYDGRKTVVLFVSDLRVGDVIDSAWTVRGKDPTLFGHHAERLSLAFPEPVATVRYRVLVPTGMPMTVQIVGENHDDPKLAPARIETATATEYRWELHAPSAVHEEPNTPPGYLPFAWAEITDFANWAEVATWGASLFRGDSAVDPKIAAWARNARVQAKSASDVILRAVRFVQDDVRYVGIEVGIASRRPSDPAAVFARRYGDCKDKTALLVAILRSEGFDARPVLASSIHGAALDQMAPSPNAFDHAIVRIEAEHVVYWVDPTTNLRGGGLPALRFSPLGKGLVLDPSTKGLATIPPEPADYASPRIVDRFRLPQPDTNGEATLESERTFEGPGADAMRGLVAVQSVDETTKMLVELYRDDIPGIRATAPTERIDDREKNVLVLRAHFGFPKAWRFGSDQRYRADVLARPMTRFLTRPSLDHRRTPIAVTYPLRVHYRMSVELPFAIQPTPSHLHVDGGAFGFDFDARIEKQTATYDCELETHAPQVVEADFTKYANALDEALLPLSRVFTYAKEAPLAPAWVFPLAAAPLFALVIWGMIRFARYAPKTREVYVRTRLPLPLGGALAFLGFGIVVSPFVFAISTYRTVSATFSETMWHAYATRGLTSYSPALLLLPLAESLATVALTVYSILIAKAFFEHRAEFPFHFVVRGVAYVSYRIVDELIVPALGLASARSTSPVGELTRIVLVFAVWASYLHMSTRVAETFVVRREPKKDRASTGIPSALPSSPSS